MNLSQGDYGNTCTEQFFQRGEVGVKRNEETVDSKHVKQEAFWQVRFELEEGSGEKNEIHNIIRSMNKHIIKCQTGQGCKYQASPTMLNLLQYLIPS